MTDKIEKTVVLEAPRARVWRAIANAEEFGQWFGVKLKGAFEPGKPISGTITYPGYEHLTMTVVVEAIEPERRLAYRWHPNATDPKHDYSDEPMTLVEFVLADAPGGTRLTITESGFDAIPLARRAQAFSADEQGWSIMTNLIDKYLAHAETRAGA